MSCASCVSRIEKTIRAVPGVTSAAVNFAAERVDVIFSDTPRPLAVVKAIEDAGYDAIAEPVELAIEGMSCASCVGRIEKALKSVPGVLEASVNLATEKALVRALAGAVSISALEAAVRGAGYEARRVADLDMADRDAEAHEREVRSLGRSVWLAALLSLPVFVLEMEIGRAHV